MSWIGWDSEYLLSPGVSIIKRAVQLVGSDPATEMSEGKLVSFPSSSVDAKGLEFSANIPSSS